jgi:tetratricopeptide (TPR) repeat protein
MPPHNSGSGPKSGSATPTAEAKGSYEDALRGLQRLRQAKGPDPRIDAQIAKLRSLLAEQHYERGVAAFRAARYRDAIGEFNQALQYQPDHHKARIYRSSAEALAKP